MINIYWSGKEALASFGYSSSAISRIATQNMRDLKAKIASFRYLQFGWHYGDGGPSPDSVVTAALQWADYLSSLGFHAINAFAGDSGEIELDAISGADYVDVIVEVDGTVTVAHDHNDKQQSYRSNLSEAEAWTHVAALTRKIWKWSAGYTATDSTLTKTGLPVWRLETRPTTAVFLSLNASASTHWDTVAAQTFVSTPTHAT